MKKSIEIDNQFVKVILKYLDNISECIIHFNINSTTDLESCDLAKLAIAQCITNTYEARKKIQEDTLLNLPLLKNLKLKMIRNIIAHDYGAVDLNIIYKTCLQLNEMPLNHVSRHHI